jgi:hypothetical protein
MTDRGAASHRRISVVLAAASKLSERREKGERLKLLFADLNGGSMQLVRAEATPTRAIWPYRRLQHAASAATALGSAPH